MRWQDASRGALATPRMMVGEKGLCAFLWYTPVTSVFASVRVRWLRAPLRASSPGVVSAVWPEGDLVRNRLSAIPGRIFRGRPRILSTEWPRCQGNDEEGHPASRPAFHIG
jgi:hypothetical protein